MHRKLVYRNSISKPFIIELFGVPASGKSSFKRIILLKLKLFDVDRLNFKMMLSDPPLVDLDYSLINTYYFNNELKGENDIRFKIKKMDFFNQKIQEDRMTLSYGKNTVNDEGLFHHFYDFWIDLGINKPNEFKKFISNRIFIYVYADNETICQNIKKRSVKFNYTWDGHLGKSDQEINELNEELNVKFRRLKSLINENGGKCIEVDTKTPLEQYTNSIHLFIKGTK
ncbi:hypothetical protein P872_01605 [Rhodonellum psychrophilum GCM71 = DSM 17998]|uniref:Uncharacterized protein n=1 Tax=Rhodonellum psychrophilum GCM71 = DSM 17998 TaxID=1123057 RepID=U5C2F3_9BACT|nr:hypothetical protein P872_01605 [Rhodonellum psychrophilum GCM71 = DSM 17998]